MQMQMQFDRAPAPTKTLMTNFLIAHMPLYWTVMAGSVAVACSDGGPVGLVGAALLHFPWLAGGMGPSWYTWSVVRALRRRSWPAHARLARRSPPPRRELSCVPHRAPRARARARAHTKQRCQFYNVLCFNSLRYTMKKSKALDCCAQDRAECCLCAWCGWRRVPSDDEPHCGCAPAADAPGPRSPRAFARRLLAFGGVATLCNAFWHPLPPLRMTQFVLGMVVGEGALSVELDAAQKRAAGRLTDGVCLLAMALKFAPGPQHIIAGVTYFAHSIPLAGVLFGLCRASSCSLAARLLSGKVFLAFVPYTYAAYLVRRPRRAREDASPRAPHRTRARRDTHRRRCTSPCCSSRKQ